MFMYNWANIRTVADATLSDFMLNCIKFMIKNTRKQFFLSRVENVWFSYSGDLELRIHSRNEPSWSVGEAVWTKASALLPWQQLFY